MLKKFAIILIVGCMAFGILPLAQAQTPQIFSGTIDDSNGCMTTGSAAFPADIIPFTVPVTGNYTFTYQSHTWGDTPGDTLLSYIVAAPYDPSVDVFTQDYMYGAASSSPLFTSRTPALNAGVTYYLAVNNNTLFTDYTTCLARASTDSGTYTITMTYADSTADPGPGCDQFIPLPAHAAVGTFTDWATLYWMPGEAVFPPMAFDPGQSAWVVGQDASGEYKKIVLSCEFLWVETRVIGPTYDAVWQGAMLPVDVVE